MKKLIENGIRLQILMRNDVKTDEISSIYKKNRWGRAPDTLPPALPFPTKYPP